MGPPLLIGAGLGAATSLAMGKNPFMGALLGGATGGAFGGAGGFGSGFTEGNLLSGFTGVEAAAAPSFATGGYANAANTFATNAVAPTVTQAATQAATQAVTPANIVGKFPNFNTAAAVTNPAAVANPIDDLALAQQRMGGYEYGKTFYPDETIQSLNQRASFAKAPNFTPLKVTPVDATKVTPVDATNGYDLAANKPLYEKAYDSVLNYAQKNPLDVAGLGLVASGAFGRKIPPTEPRTGSINKGTAPQVAQMLQVKRPTRFA